MPSLVVIIVSSYLLGSIPFGYLLVRIFRGEDVRKSGSGNIGATNVARKSPVLGALTLVLDAAKGSGAVALSMSLSPAGIGCLDYLHRSLTPAHMRIATLYGSIAALFAIVGHMFPVWLKFRGGKGVATALGAFALIAPKAVLVAAAIFALVVLIFRYASLGSIIAVVLFPVLTWLLHEYDGDGLVLLFMALASALIIAKHHANIRRLLAGTENRFGSKRAVQSAIPPARSEKP